MSSGSRRAAVAYVTTIVLVSMAVWIAHPGPPPAAAAATQLTQPVQPVQPARALQALRVCADPNNLPFSNARGEGFENAIARLVAQDLGRTLSYVWWPQRRGFVRHTLAAGTCDLIIGVPATFAMARPTRPYYRSTYVFVSRRDRHLHLRSLDDPALRQLRIGIQITGEDYANPPAAQALASRQIIENVRGFPVYGNYATPFPLDGVMSAVSAKAVDVAIVWGPLAGFVARHAGVPLDLVPVTPAIDQRVLRFTFDISMGVRRNDAELADRLNDVIERRAGDIRRILLSFGVPLV